MNHVDEDLFGRLEAERRRIADVELDDSVTLFFHPCRFGEHGTANVVADVRELRRFRDRAVSRRSERVYVHRSSLLFIHVACAALARGGLSLRIHSNSSSRMLQEGPR